MSPGFRLTPIPEDMDLSDIDKARKYWDPYHPSAQIERQVKIRACLDLATVIRTVPATYWGVLSELLAKFTDKVEQRDSLSRARTKLTGLKAKGEFPFSYNSLKIPSVQYMKGARALWNETWSVPAEGSLIEFKKTLLGNEILLINRQLEQLVQLLDEQNVVKEAWVALSEQYKRRPQDTQYRVALPDEVTATDWPLEAPLVVSTENFQKNELQALQVDLPAYFRKVLDLKLDLIERIHGKKDKKAAEKRDVEMAVQDVASTDQPEVQELIDRGIQSGLAKMEDNLRRKYGLAPTPSSSKKPGKNQDGKPATTLKEKKKAKKMAAQKATTQPSAKETTLQSRGGGKGPKKNGPSAKAKGKQRANQG